MGWDAAGLLRLFRDPMYPVLNTLLASYGEEEVGRRVEALLARSGAPRFRETLVEDSEPEDDETDR